MLCLIIILEPKSPLFDFNHGTGSYPDLGRDDCRTLYGSLALEYNASTPMKPCQCDKTSFANPNRTQCCKYFQMTLCHVNIEYDSFSNLSRASVIHESH